MDHKTEILKRSKNGIFHFWLRVWVPWVQLMKSGLITQRTLDRIPGQEENYQNIPPSVKRVPGLTGEQSTPAVSHYPPIVLVGLQVPTLAVWGTVSPSCELLARAPGVCTAPAHCTCLVHRCPGLTRNAWPTKAAKGFLCVCCWHYNSCTVGNVYAATLPQKDYWHVSTNSILYLAILRPIILAVSLHGFKYPCLAVDQYLYAGLA